MSDVEKDPCLIMRIEDIEGKPIVGFCPPGYTLYAIGPNTHHALRVTRSKGSCTLDADNNPTQIVLVLEVEPDA